MKINFLKNNPCPFRKRSATTWGVSCRWLGNLDLNDAKSEDSFSLLGVAELGGPLFATSSQGFPKHRALCSLSVGHWNRGKASSLHKPVKRALAILERGRYFGSASRKQSGKSCRNKIPHRSCSPKDHRPSRTESRHSSNGPELCGITKAANASEKGAFADTGQRPGLREWFCISISYRVAAGVENHEQTQVRISEILELGTLAQPETGSISKRRVQVQEMRVWSEAERPPYSIQAGSVDLHGGGRGNAVQGLPSERAQEIETAEEKTPQTPCAPLASCKPDFGLFDFVESTDKAFQAKRRKFTRDILCLFFLFYGLTACGCAAQRPKPDGWSKMREEIRELERTGEANAPIVIIKSSGESKL